MIISRQAAMTGSGSAWNQITRSFSCPHQQHARTITTSMISCLPRSSPTRPRTTTPATFTPAIETRVDETTVDQRADAFQDHGILAKAEQRWGLGSSTEYSPIVFPQGRPEIADLVQQMRKTRISSGIIPQKNKNKNNSDNFNTTATTTATGPRNRFEKATPNQHLHKPLYGQLQEEAPIWLKHKISIKEKLDGARWNPVKKVTRQTMEEIRFLHKQFPEDWTTSKLADHFNIAGEAVRRILRSQDFVPAPERALKQDEIRTFVRKTKVSESLAQMRAEGHALFLERQAKREQHEALAPRRKITRFKPVGSTPKKTNTNNTTETAGTASVTPPLKPTSAPRIKLGAPKRAIE